MDKWLANMADKYVTIADILDLKLGQTVKFLCIDRNFGDSFNGDMDAEPKSLDCFEYNNILLYKYDKDLLGLGRFENEDVEIDGYCEFPFDLNYRDGCWFPLDNKGFLPEHLADETDSLDYREYPKTTRIGFRGPMIKWTDVVESLKVKF
jgi:hypothetical protein